MSENKSKIAVKYSFQELQKETGPVFIFGAGVVGEALLYACREKKLEVKAFCDNNRNKTSAPFAGLEVFYAREMKVRFPDAVFLVAVIDIQDIVEQLAGYGYEHIYAASDILKSLDLFAHHYSKPAEFVNYVVTTCILSHESYVYPDRIFFHSIDLVITERCSLKCRDCSNLMQYYRHPADLASSGIFRSVDLVCSSVDSINEFRIIGGEPFMNKDWARIIAYVNAKEKVKKTVIFTNGTICPDFSELDSMDCTKILFIITDYGSLSRNIDKMERELKKQHINYLRSPAGNWTACSDIGKHSRSPEELQECFKNCCAKNLFTIMHGKLYRCPFAANADALHAVPPSPSDYVILDEESGVREKIKDFVYSTQYLSTCDYCNGRRLDDPVIPAAIQLKSPRG